MKPWDLAGRDSDSIDNEYLWLRDIVEDRDFYIRSPDVIEALHEALLEARRGPIVFTGKAKSDIRKMTNGNRQHYKEVKEWHKQQMLPHLPPGGTGTVR